MQVHWIVSSNIKAIAHQGTDLFILFNAGSTYVYPGVPAEEFEQMLAADSVGKFFHANIRPNYGGTQIEFGDPRLESFRI